MGEAQGQVKGLVERRMERNRRDLITAAMSLFHERGYDATTVEEIAEAVEVSPRTFYRHFPSKADIVTGMPKLGFAQVVASLRARPPEESVVDGLRIGVETAMRESDPEAMLYCQLLLTQCPDLQTRALEEYRRSELLLATALAERVGAEPDEQRIRIAAAAIVGMLRVTVEHWCGTPPTSSDPLPLVMAGLDLLAPMLERALEHAGP
jgi:AcrR family transcriptional regulator